MLARQVMDSAETQVDLLQAFRIQRQSIDVMTQGAAGLIELDQRTVEQFDDRFQRRIVTTQFLQQGDDAVDIPR